MPNVLYFTVNSGQSGSHMPPMYLRQPPVPPGILSRMNEKMRRRQLEPSQSSTAGMPAKLNLSGGKDWNDAMLSATSVFISEQYPRDSTGGHVAGASAAYENQALLFIQKF